jgi:hypothetical protein
MNTTLNLWFDFLKVFGPTVILPIFILWLNGRQTRKNKQVDQKYEIDKFTKTKELEQSFASNREKRDHEKIVHSSLIKILFEVQKLHISLSGNCTNFKCLEDATNNFKEAFSKYQSIIADNQIYLSSGITNLLYSFYNTLGQLMIELQDIQEAKNYDLAIVPVYDYSQKLADNIIDIQELFISKRADLTTDFNRIELTDFKACCGHQPPKHLRSKYYLLKNQINNLGEPLTDKLVRQQELTQLPSVML